MRLTRSIFFLLFLIGFQSSFAQKAKPSRLNKTDKVIVASLQQHIGFLADDKLKGRRAGTDGEKMAMEYISKKFIEIGLESKGVNGYFQPFEIYDGKQISNSNHLMIDGNILKPGTDFFPMPWSENINLEALPAISIQEAEMPWFFDLSETLEENANNPHFDLNEFLKTKAKEVKSKGATALIVYNLSDKEDKLEFNSKDRSEKVGLPVIYITKGPAKKYFSDQSATIDLKLKTEVVDKIRTGNNVIGYIDNGANGTIAIGAHYDHLGYGEDGNSMNRTAVPAIHNGADDNASGTAAMIELARLLKNSKNKNHNYLFIAFSAEELGLNGSKYFVENPTIDLKSINYMINMDMVGRLNDSTNTLTVGGFGTSPQWDQLVKREGKTVPFNVRIDSSGTGPSDHTSFYRKDIPVLFLFTGLHSDYHKPGDDAEKINYAGTLQILYYVNSIINGSNDLNQKLAFTKTRETQTGSSARFSVSLGVMPDYTYSGSGVRIDGVSEGKAAQKAGMKAGDIIIQLGDINVSSVENYMQALSKFKKGDSTRLKFKRGNEVIEADVQF